MGTEHLDVVTLDSPEEARAFAQADGREWIVTGSTVSFAQAEDSDRGHALDLDSVTVEPDGSPGMPCASSEAQLRYLHALGVRRRDVRAYPPGSPKAREFEQWECARVAAGDEFVLDRNGLPARPALALVTEGDAVLPDASEPPPLFTEADYYAAAEEIAALPETEPERVHAPAPVPVGPRFPIFTEEELGQFPPVEWFPGLDGVLPRRELVGLWGPGDSYKSFTALDWSCFLAAQGFGVLYIAAEGVSGLKRRVAAWKVVHGIDSLPNLRVVSMPVRMHNGTDVAAFVADVRAQMPTPALVVVDTLARNFVGGNENSAQDMGNFVEGCETLRRVLDCAVLVIHHATKDGASERGGESLRNASFAMYRFERKSTRSVLVACERMKDAEPPKPVKVEPQVVDLGDGVSSLVAGWPFGDARTELVFEAPSEDESFVLLKARIAQDVTEVVKQWGSGGDVLSETQIVKRVKGRDSLVREVAKELALASHSPVQSRRNVKADGSPGRSIDYYFEPPH